MFMEMSFIQQFNIIKKRASMLLVPHTLASELPLSIVGQATRSHAVYGYSTPQDVCKNIHADIHCCNALTIVL